MTNHRALHYRRIHGFLADLRAGNSQPVTKLAFEWLVLTSLDKAAEAALMEASPAWLTWLTTRL